LRVAGVAMKEAILAYAKFRPNIQVEGAKTSLKMDGVVFAVAVRR
jgi:hypothetical protein